MNEKYIITINAPVSPDEIVFVREENTKELDLWQSCIAQSLCIVSARIGESDSDQKGALVGIGFLVGNARHGQIVDLVVHSAHRGKGLGGMIFDALVIYAKDLGIRYLGLTYDKKDPWLKDFYERHGFNQIDFAMWEKECLAALNYKQL